MGEKIEYQSDWITAQQAAALFDSPEQFVKAVEDGKVKATGRLWDEFDPQNWGERKPISSSAWEDCKFEPETGHLIGDEPDSPWTFKYLSIRVFYPDITSLGKSGQEITKPKAMSEEELKPSRGGRPKEINDYLLAVNIAACIGCDNKTPVPQIGESPKKFIDFLIREVPFFQGIEASDKTIERAVKKFLKPYYAASAAIDAEEEKNEKAKG